MKQAELMMDLGTKATFFGLGLLASKKLRPYAKFFIIAGVAATAVPGIMIAVEQIKAKQASREAKVEEVAVEAVTPCCQAEETDCCQEAAQPECCCEGQTDCCDTNKECAEAAAEDCHCQEDKPVE